MVPKKITLLPNFTEVDNAFLYLLTQKRFEIFLVRTQKVCWNTDLLQMHLDIKDFDVFIRHLKLALDSMLDNTANYIGLEVGETIGRFERKKYYGHISNVNDLLTQQTKIITIVIAKQDGEFPNFILRLNPKPATLEEMDFDISLKNRFKSIV